MDVRFTGKARSMWRKVPMDFFDTRGWVQERPNVTSCGGITVIRRHWHKGAMNAFFCEMVPTF